MTWRLKLIRVAAFMSVVEIFRQYCRLDEHSHRFLLFVQLTFEVSDGFKREKAEELCSE